MNELYAVHGAVTSLRLGNGLWEHAIFNSRLQPTEIGLGASATDSGVLKLGYKYGELVGGTLDQTRNNGNLQSQTISVPQIGTISARTFTQTYTYDSLNRLKSAQETQGTTSTWRQAYTYDPFGNRRLDASLNAQGEARTTKPSTQQLQQSPNVYNPAVSTATNRIDDPGYAYDAAGNLLCDPTHPCGPGATPSPYYRYDADNKLMSAGGSAQSGGAEYAYDGGGRRVKKAWGGQVTLFVYDAMGKLIAEYSNQVTGGGVSYLTTDHLRSTRVVTGQGGASEVKGRFDYLPFGEEVEGRAGCGSVGVRQNFTGYERDAETGLDFAQARHYSSQHGRFTSSALLTSSERRRHDEVNDAPAPGEVRTAVERLREDHDFFMRELAGAVNTAREMASQDGPPDRERLQQIRGRASAVVERLVEHNRIEEQQVYLRPDSLLAGTELDTLRAGVRREIENLPPRFSERAPR